MSLKVLRRGLSIGSAVAVVLAGTVFVGTAQAVHVTCGSVITQSTVLDSNVGPCSAPVTIGASNVLLDMNGFTIFGGPNVGDGDGIVFDNVTRSEVRNGTVRDFDTGIFVDRGSNNTIQQMEIQNNNGFDGAFIFRSDFTRFLTNRVVNNGRFSGITLEDSSGSQVRGNTIQGNVRGTAIGIWILNNRDRPVEEGDPDLVGLQASHNVVAGNFVQGNALDGIQVSRFSTRNVVHSNHVVANGVLRTNPVRDGSGIIVFGNENTIRDNVSVRNGGHGVAVIASTSANTGRAQGVNNILLTNQAFGNDAGTLPAVFFDLFDGNPNCDNNGWHGNTGQTFNQPCVLAP